MPAGFALRNPAGSVIFRPAMRFRAVKAPRMMTSCLGGAALTAPARLCVIRNVVAGRLRPVIPASGQRTVRCSGSARRASPRPSSPAAGHEPPEPASGCAAADGASRSPATGRMPTLPRVYNAGQEHNRLPREILAVICQDIARVKFQVGPRRPTCALSGRPVMHDERLRRERSTTVRLACRRIDEDGQFSGRSPD